MKTSTARALLIIAAALIAALLLAAAGYAAGRAYTLHTAPRIVHTWILDDPISDPDGAAWRDPADGCSYDFRTVIQWSDGTTTYAGGYVG